MGRRRLVVTVGGITPVRAGTALLGPRALVRTRPRRGGRAPGGPAAGPGRLTGPSRKPWPGPAAAGHYTCSDPPDPPRATDGYPDAPRLPPCRRPSRGDRPGRRPARPV